MKVSLNWIKQLTDITLEEDELMQRIASRIGEIEHLERLSEKYKGIVIAEIKSAEKHPNADKLNIYQVDDGSGETVQVVGGGAHQLEAGSKVAYMPPGVTVPATFGSSEPLVLEARELRGETSNGMLASAKELGFGDDHSGILPLDTDAKPGTSFAQVYELDDVVFDIENKVLTHRPDCFGLIGLAREIAGIQGVQFKTPEWYLQAQNELKAEDKELKVEIDNQLPEVVPRITLLAFSGVTIKPSPVLMQSYLSRIGIRPLNNVVDITNYMAVLSGQPLHAFDYDKLAERSSGDYAHVVVRYPKQGERLSLIDGRDIEPHEKAILICTDQQAVAVGGLMGGADTEVSEQTTNVLMEAANFDLYSIRDTSMRHGIFSEAGTRFARGQDPSQCAPAQAKTAEMMRELSGAKTASELIDDYPKPKEGNVVKAGVDFINKRLGASYSADDMARTLRHVELGVEERDGELAVTTPTWRGDLHIAEDIVEEIGRLNGYDNLPTALPHRSVRAVGLNDLEYMRSKVRAHLSRAGANELLTYNFVSDDLFDKTGQDREEAYHIRNSISPELQYMRTSLTPSLLDKVYPNIRQGFSEFALFEINKTHSKKELHEEDKLPVERHSVALVFTADDQRTSVYAGAPFYQAKRYVEHLFTRLHMSDPELLYTPLHETGNLPWWLENVGHVFEPQRSALMAKAGQPVGIVGEYNAAVRRAFKLPRFSAGFELDLGQLIRFAREFSHYQPLSRFPGTEQDVTFEVGADVAADKLWQAVIQGIDGEIYDSSSMRDIFQKSEQTDKKRVTFRIRLRHHERTLTTEEANQAVDAMVTLTEKQFGAKRI